MDTFPRIAHLDDLRRSFVEGGPGLPDMTQRLLLDTIGVGNRQAFDFLVQSRPTQSEFEAWIAETTGGIDCDLVSRFNAWAGHGEPTDTAKADIDAVEAMDDVLGPDEIASWERDGYVVLPGAIDGAHCAQISALVWDRIGASPDDPGSWASATTDGIMVPLYRHPAIDRARAAPRIRKAFAQLWGLANLWATIDQLGFNPPEHGGNVFRGSGIHWDVSLARPIPFATQGVLYLTDTAEDQGAFRCVPGFHHRIDQWIDDIGDRQPREVDLEGEARCIAGSAGDLVIWRQDLPHGASPNRSDRPRLVQYINYYSPDLRVAEEWI